MRVYITLEREDNTLLSMSHFTGFSVPGEYTYGIMCDKVSVKEKEGRHYKELFIRKRNGHSYVMGMKYIKRIEFEG